MIQGALTLILFTIHRQLNFSKRHKNVIQLQLSNFSYSTYNDSNQYINSFFRIPSFTFYLMFARRPSCPEKVTVAWTSCKTTSGTCKSHRNLHNLNHARSNGLNLQFDRNNEWGQPPSSVQIKVPRLLALLDTFRISDNKSLEDLELLAPFIKIAKSVVNCMQELGVSWVC